MAKLSALHDPAVLKRIVVDREKAASGSAVKEEPIKVRTIKLAPGQKYFSKVFGWTPKTIPDIPVTVWKDTDWSENARIMIPSPNSNWQWDEPVVEQFAMAMYFNDTLLLHGLQGTGKSDLAKEWCATVRMPMWRQSCHEETREAHFVGSPSVEYDDKGNMHITQEPTLLTDSLREGGMFIEDEAFRHSVALVLQSLREKNTRTLLLPDAPGRSAKERILKADPVRWRYVLTDNTSGTGDTTGLFQAQVQDASTLDRITAAIEVNYLPPDKEKKILKGAFDGLDNTTITRMVTFARDVRSAYRAGKMQTTMSVRGLLAWGEKIEVIGDAKIALRMSWFSKLSQENQAVALDIFKQVFAENL